MPFKKCSFCFNTNKNNSSASYFKITKEIFEHLSLPGDYGEHICSEHFLGTEIENNRLKAGSLPSFLHLKSVKDHDHGYAGNSILGKAP